MNAYFVRKTIQTNSPLNQHYPFKQFSSMRPVVGDWEMLWSELNPEQLTDLIDLHRHKDDVIEIISLGPVLFRPADLQERMSGLVSVRTDASPQ